jgi:hypothetical protein
VDEIRNADDVLIIQAPAGFRLGMSCQNRASVGQGIRVGRDERARITP